MIIEDFSLSYLTSPHLSSSSELACNFKLGQKILKRSSGEPRTLKGEISIKNNAGQIRLRWRYRGRCYGLNLPFDYAPEDLHHVAVKSAKIKLYIVMEEFDPTLAKYQPTEFPDFDNGYIV